MFGKLFDKNEYAYIEEVPRPHSDLNTNIIAIETFVSNWIYWMTDHSTIVSNIIYTLNPFTNYTTERTRDFLNWRIFD